VSKLSHLEALGSYLDTSARRFCRGESQHSWANPLS